MRIDTPSDIYGFLGSIPRRKRENFGIILLDTQRNVIGKKVMFMGTVSSCNVGKRELLVYALKKDAVGVILFHNHPSGNTEPSQDDIKTTDEIRKGCKAVGLQLIDHIVVGRWGYHSFKELDLLKDEKKEFKKVAE